MAKNISPSTTTFGEGTAPEIGGRARETLF